MQVRQRCAVHFIGDECRLLDRLPRRDALDEIRGLVGDAGIGAVEDDFDRLFLEANLVEEIFQPRAFPTRTTHGPIAPFDARNVRLEQSAPIARAQIDRDQFGGREAFEIVEGEGGLAISTFAPDGEFPGSHIHLRNKGEVIADEKRVSRGDGGAKLSDRVS